MQFFVDADHGDAVVGWVLPDNPGATPRIAASIGNGPPVEFQANVFRPDIKNMGVHTTGMVGFCVDGTILSGLKKSDDILIRDADSDVMIYRRFKEGLHIPMRLMRYEITAMPQLPIDSAFASRFAMVHEAVERMSLDTLYAVLTCNWSPAQYVSGRPFLTRYFQQLRDRGFKTIILLRDPIEELAERLIFLKFAAGQNRPEFVLNHLTGLKPLVDLAARINLDDDNSLATFFNGVDQDQQIALSNPFVRGLACGPDEIPDNMHVSIALENLANFDLVCTRDRFDNFKVDLAKMLGTDILRDQKITTVSNVPVLAKKLARLRAVHRLLALDIKLYRFAAEAVEKAYGGS